MAKIDHDIVAQLMANIASPDVIGAIDRAIEATERQREELVLLRKMAVRRHGEPEPARVPVADHNLARALVVQFDDATVREPAGAMTISELIHRYRTDPHSPLQGLRFRTRENYESLMRRINKDIGKYKLTEIDAELIRAIYDEWSANGQVAISHSLLTNLRVLASYAEKELKSRDARDLRFTLHDFRAPRPAPRGVRLTSEHVDAIIAKAHEMGLASIALAQAIQFDCRFKQKDVIGEWVPIGEAGEPHLIWEQEKWTRGIRWDEVDSELVLRHVTSAKGELVERHLKEAPRVMAELSKLASPLPSSGPIIVSEKSGRPYITHVYRYVWRKVADAAGVPKDVRNMDTRD